MPATPCRERRSWTAKEDQLLREAVEKEDPENPNPSKWHAIAKHVPNRTNKDCRKRWFAKMASDVVKGGWSPEEDERLVRGIKMYGTRRWSLVASIVQTRNSDQCAKRWTDTLNPAIDRTMWTPEADEMLLKAVAEHGKVWTKIVKTYFPGRTGLSAKNRLVQLFLNVVLYANEHYSYNSITRFTSDSARARARRRTPESPTQQIHRKSDSTSSTSSSSSSASSSCNTTPSPVTPTMSIPGTVSSPSFQSNIFDTFSGWASTPTTPMDNSFNHNISIQLNSPHNFDHSQHSLQKPQLIDPSFQTFEHPMHQTFPAFANHQMAFQNDTVLQMFSHTPQQQQQQQQQQQSMYSTGLQEAAPIYMQGSISNDISGQMAMFGSLPHDVDPFMGFAWDNAGAPVEVKQHDRFIAPAVNETLFIF
ncbi:hypothetical protein AMATHDRAFT_48231 [Amanita thiersii Skay4041]|uniref:Uncharacterized protein n=1 Tax=Amanita thiersii Skay4041 TaxID=703135 RepID=A0A2A9NQP1_9AGAR|nr:hypothetical protein AMATHDRAFT_48231 [Amanita thiersii Skay4041]